MKITFPSKILEKLPPSFYYTVVQCHFSDRI